MHLDRAALAVLHSSMTAAESDAATLTAEIAGLLSEAQAALGSGRLAEAFAPGFGRRCASVSADLARVVEDIGTHRAALGAADAIIAAADETAR